MRTRTQELTLRGGVMVFGALLVSGVAGWARHPTADGRPSRSAASALPREAPTLSQSLEAARGELAVARLQLQRADAII